MTTRVLLIEPCTTIQDAGRALCEAATEYGGTVEADFNGVLLVADENTRLDQVVAEYFHATGVREQAKADAVAVVHRKAAAFDKLEAYLRESEDYLTVGHDMSEVGTCPPGVDWAMVASAPTLLELVEKLEEA